MKLGSLNFFSSKKKDYGTLHCLDTREWNDGYNSDNKSLIKFLKQEIKSKSTDKFLKNLMKRDNYKKFVDKNITETLNKITCVKNTRDDTDGLLPKIDYFIYPTNFVDEKDRKSVPAFKIFNTTTAFNFDGPGTGTQKGKFNVLTIMTISNNTEFWSKKINYEKRVRDIGFQYIILDKDEYDKIRKYKKTFTDIKDDNYAKAWDNQKMLLDIYGLFDSEKRKKYPVNMFEHFMAFEE
jgi:hypothetical protein